MDSGAGDADAESRLATQQSAGSAELQVEPAKLTEVADVVEERAEVLARTVQDAWGVLHINPPAHDFTSRAALRGWNALLTEGAEPYLDRVLRYVTQLRDLADRLRRAAAEYGANEQHTAAELDAMAPGGQ